MGSVKEKKFRISGHLGLLDRFILQALMGPFCLGVFAFTTIFVGSDLLFRLAELMVKFGASAWTAFRIFILSLPSIMVLTFPMSMLLAVILTFSRLSTNSETIALMAGGFSLKRLVLPTIIFALLIVIFTIFLNEAIVPDSNLIRNRLMRDALGEKPIKTQRNIVLKDFNSGQLLSLIYAREFDGTNLILKGVTVQEFEGDILSRVTRAESVVWTENAWYFYNGTVYAFGDDGKVFPLQFKKQIMYLPQSPEDIAAEHKSVAEMNTNEIKERIRIMAEEGEDTASLEVEMHMRWAIPFASVIFTLIGAPLGLQPRRGGTTGFSFGLSLIIIFVYYVLTTFSNTLGQQGSISSVLSAWLANIIIGTMGFYLLFRANR